MGEPNYLLLHYQYQLHYIKDSLHIRQTDSARDPLLSVRNLQMKIRQNFNDGCKGNWFRQCDEVP